MKKGLFILMVCLLSTTLYAQNFSDNGKNLKDICPAESCSYITFSASIYFPFEEDKQWEIKNMEVATKKNGNFIGTGDLYVHGVDTAAILSLDLVYYSESDEEIFRYSVPGFEFYNEPASAEPFVYSGKMTPEQSQQVGYLDVEIKNSKVLPYYEISSDCYHACKELKLKEAIKAFKKAK